MCVQCSTRSFRGMETFYFKIEYRRDILKTTLLTRITAHKQSLTIGSKHKHHIQLLGNDANDQTKTRINLYSYSLSQLCCVTDIG